MLIQLLNFEYTKAQMQWRALRHRGKTLELASGKQTFINSFDVWVYGYNENGYTDYPFLS